MMERKKIDLSLGNTDFLQEYWANHDGVSHALKHNWMMGYQRNGGRPELIDQIRELHDVVGNCNHRGKYIVLGHGIRQLLAAAIHAQAYYTDREKVFADPPNFFLFEDIVFQLGGLDFVNTPGGFDPDRMLNIITSPSNPINMRGQGESGPYNVWDLCYNWGQYGDVGCFNDVLPMDVQIFGLAKATGHAGTRLGWAFVESKEIADEMRRFIHNATGGVSVEAQARAEDIILSQFAAIKLGQETVFDYGRRILDSRWADLHHAGLLIEGHQSELHVTNVSGMFAWCHYPMGAFSTAADRFQDEFGIEVMGGYRCYPDATDMIRINIGCSSEDFKILLDRLQAVNTDTL